MDLRDFNKRLTDLVDERENDVNNHNTYFVEEKNNICTYMAVEEHGRPFDNENKFFSLMAVREHGRPFDKSKLITRMAIGEHGRPFDFEKELQKQEEFLYNLRKLKK